MAGTLTISTLSDGTNSTSSTNCIQGSAKAWVRFQGSSSAATINASYNVSSVTRNGSGDYTINFTSSFTDANYCFTATMQSDASGTGTLESVVVKNGSTILTTSLTILTLFQTGSTTGSAGGTTAISLACFR
jgi:hypothetical protein